MKTIVYKIASRVSYRRLSWRLWYVQCRTFGVWDRVGGQARTGFEP